jgi:hypothetical protein
MLVDNGQFIQLSNNHPYSTLNGQPLYIDSKKICFIRPSFDVNGYANGSYVYLDGNTKEDDALRVKESPEDIIGLINDGTFCSFSNKFPYDQLPYPGK